MNFNKKRIKPNPYDPNAQGYTYDTIVNANIIYSNINKNKN